MRNAISEKYRKYLIKLYLDNGRYFIVWGTDMSSADENDFVLTDKDNKVLCFLDCKTIPDFLNTRVYLMKDIDNFRNWVNKFSFSSPYTSYHIFILKRNKGQDSLSVKSRFSLVENINLINDYAIQTNNQKLIRLTKNKTIKRVWNKIYDIDFWNKKTKIILIDSDIELFIENYNKMVYEFIQNIIVISS